MRIQHVELKITLDDGTVVEGIMSPEGDQRWGADLPHLGACVAPMSAMSDALSENGHWVRDADEDEDDG